MAQLPADVNAGDPGHSDHHDVLHATHNALDALSVGEIPVRSAGGFDAVTVAAIVAAAKAGNLVTDTITGNDVLTSWDVAHNLGVANVRVLLFRADGSQVDDDQYDFVPTVGNTLNSTTITIPEGTPGGPLPNGVALTVYVTAASGAGGLSQDVNTQTGTTYTTVATDSGGIVEMSNAAANTVTIPPNVFAIGARLDIVQAGTGKTTIAPGAGVTLRSNGSIYSLAGQWAAASLYQRASNEWVIAGALQP